MFISILDIVLHLVASFTLEIYIPYFITIPLPIHIPIHIPIPIPYLIPIPYFIPIPIHPLDLKPSTAQLRISEHVRRILQRAILTGV